MIIVSCAPKPYSNFSGPCFLFEGPWDFGLFVQSFVGFFLDFFLVTRSRKLTSVVKVEACLESRV